MKRILFNILIVILFIIIIILGVKIYELYSENIQNVEKIEDLRIELYLKDREYYDICKENESLKNSISNISRNWLYVPVEIDCEWKSWMDYRTITDKSSRQYRIVNGVGCCSDENGLMMVGGWYCVAMGS